MEKNTFILAQKVTGQERKVIAGLIAKALGAEASYEGVPSFAYTAGGWRIEKSGLVKSPPIGFQNADYLKAVLDVLKAEGLTAEGDATVVLSTEGQTGVTLRNLANIISSKGLLLEKALVRQQTAIPAALVEALNETPIESLEDFMRIYNSGLEAGRYANSGDLWLQHLPKEIGFSFFNASLNAEDIMAYITLAYKLGEQAKAQKYASVKQKEAENEKYAMRCFLLRLGFIGDEYKLERKVLLSKLEGNGSWKRPVEVLQKSTEGGLVNE